MNIINPSGLPYMRLYRYELFCDGENQNIGFLAGLGDLGLSSEKEERLLAPFDSLLEIPDVADMRDSMSFFTELGNRRFAGPIQAVISAYGQNGLFDVVQYIADIPDTALEEAVYKDDDQVCLTKHPYVAVATLLPCPCGGPLVLEDWICAWESGTTVRCQKCGATACDGVENGNGWRERAIRSWNQRCEKFKEMKL